MSEGPRHPHRFERLRRRAEFVAVGKGVRVRREAFGLQARPRADAADEAPRYGITVTKKTAPRAVDRNRMRRRLRDALRRGAALSGVAGHDYVIVGRLELLVVPFGTLQNALASALAEVQHKIGRRAPARVDRSAKEAGA